jgi:DNA polymerase-3 subunit epsilon|tara:strand:+ start:218 stop:616 length:399 start_codon:yes stop_codon:yes gene_type:complete
VKEIQPFIENLTGINKEMLKNAPKFKDISKKIMDITNNCTLVAHNADFDYRVLRNEFTNIGVNFNRKTLCTIELSKELLPEQDSYSLGKLTTSLGIKIEKRHRADGDAMATLKLFKMLLEKDKANVIDRLTK